MVGFQSSPAMSGQRRSTEADLNHVKAHAWLGTQHHRHVANPKGIASLSPGLVRQRRGGRGYPGTTQKQAPRPEWVASPVRNLRIREQAMRPKPSATPVPRFALRPAGRSHRGLLADVRWLPYERREKPAIHQ